MVIGIDASRAFGKERTGTEEYSYQIIKHLAKMKIGSQVVLYLRKKDLANIDFDLPDNFKLKIISPSRFWTQIGLALEMMINKPDVLFVPSYAVPQIHSRRTVVTIHGLEFRHFSECYSLKERFILELNTQFSIKWASKIIVPSENTKKDLMEFYKVDADKIKVIAHGAESRKSIKSKVHKVKKFNILFVGRLEKRKNLVNSIKAFDLFKSNSQFAIRNSQFILAGKRGFGFTEIKKAIEKSPFKKNIILKGYISEEEKSELYKNADLFILPSFYEGFGLPILEAMNYGVPVICSDNSSLPEVAGGAALLTDSNNPEEIAAAMNKVFSDGSFKNKMIERGFENVKKFSWEKCARETMEIILSS